MSLIILENGKPFLFPLPFSAQQAHLFLPLPLFPFLSRGPKLYRRPNPSPSPRPSSAPLPLSHRQVGSARRTPLPPRARLGLEPESGRGTPLRAPGPACRGPVLAPIKAPRPSPNPLEPVPPPRANPIPSRAPPLLSSGARSSAPCRRSAASQSCSSRPKTSHRGEVHRMPILPSALALLRSL